MSDKFKFNGVTGQLDLVEHIPELTSDPASPREEDAWVLNESVLGSGGGIIQGWIGLASTPILTTSSASSVSYKLSYKTNSGTIVRVDLS